MDSSSSQVQVGHAGAGAPCIRPGVQGWDGNGLLLGNRDDEATTWAQWPMIESVGYGPVTAVASQTLQQHTHAISIQNASHPLILLSYKQMRIKLLLFISKKSSGGGGNVIQIKIQFPTGYSASRVGQYQLVSLNWLELGLPRRLPQIRPGLSLKPKHWLVG